MKNNKRVISILLSITIIIFFPLLSICKEHKNYFLVDEEFKLCFNWNEKCEEKNDYANQICLTPGEDESKLNFSWYSEECGNLNKLKIYDKENYEEIVSADSVKMKNGLRSNKVTVNNLKPNTTYYYSYTIDGKWTDPVTYRTRSLETFSFIFMGDPQVGASYKNKNKDSYEKAIKEDTYNWNKVIEKSLNTRLNASFIVCAGDETNTKTDKYRGEKNKISDMENNGFLYPYFLKSIPIANTVGNHDKDNEDYYYRYNMPNLSRLGDTIAGGDYYFTYNNTLFLMLNTNNLNMSEHEEFIKEAINESNNTKWKIAIFHHDIYGCGKHSRDKDMNKLRKKLVPILEENNIDLSLTGHDHIYSRSYVLKNNKIEKHSTTSRYDNNKKLDIDVISNPNGIIYITGNSSTGSKFYKSDDNDEYTKVRFYDEIPTFTVIDVCDNSIEIITYRVDNDEIIDDIRIIKE